MIIDGLTNGKHLVKLKYERLPNFCYNCGLLGHVEKKCEHSTEDISAQVKGFGDWMRAFPLPIKGSCRGGAEYTQSNHWKAPRSEGFGSSFPNKGGGGKEDNMGHTPCSGSVARKLNMNRESIKIHGVGKEGMLETLNVKHEE
ncbi:hypothetical protein REPUB_Repub06bG0100400 [Reevesia pubescens]